MEKNNLGKQPTIYTFYPRTKPTQRRASENSQQGLERSRKFEELPSHLLLNRQERQIIAVILIATTGK
jgi:hypothetical protein